MNLPKICLSLAVPVITLMFPGHARGAVDSQLEWAMYERPLSAVSSVNLPAFGDAGSIDEVEINRLVNYAAVRISDEVASRYAGSRIESIKVASGLFGEGASSEIMRVSLAYSLDGNSVFSRDYNPIGSEIDPATLGVTWNYDNIEVNSESPIVLEEGKEMYVIFRYTETSTDSQEYVVGFNSDGVATPEGSYFSALEGSAVINGKTKRFTKQWADVSQDPALGPLCVSLTLSGAEGGIRNSVELLSLDLPERVIPGDIFSITARVHNIGSNEVNAITALCNIDGEVIERNYDSLSLGAGATSDITFAGLSCDEDCVLSVKVSLMEINGESNGAVKSTSASGTIKCLTEGYVPNLVVEEGTGTWCGWCVRGIVAMRQMYERHPDGSFIGLAVHKDDEMQAEEATPVYSLINKWVGSYPAMIVDRRAGYDVTLEDMETLYDKGRSSITYAKIDVDACIDKDELVVVSTSVFAVNDDKNEYKVAYAVLEDNVGPYVQTNIYSGGKYGPMDGFEDLGPAVEMIYDDVVRCYYGCDGVPGSLPAEVKKGETYRHECRIPLINVENRDEVSLVAMLIDTSTGEIVNAVKSPKLSSGVDAVEAETVGGIDVEGRTFTLHGDNKAIALYSPDGRKVMELRPEVPVDVEPGIYLAKIGAKSFKLIVK